MKRHNTRNQINLNNKRHHSANRLLTSTVGTIMSLILLSCFISATPASATSGTLSLSLSSDTVSLNISPTNASGTFSTSPASTISAWTDNATGYTLKLSSNNTASDANKYLVNVNDSNEHLTSIDSITTSTNFNAGEWGYIPSQYYNSSTGEIINNTGSNPNYLPAPGSTGDILALTTTANNGSASTNADTYTIALGAKVDYTVKTGTYRNNTFVVQLVSNAIPYTITYVDNVVGSMPVDIISAAEGSTVPVSSNTPTRDGYTFVGWCTVAPTINSNGTDTCSGTTYYPTGTITIDRTGGANDYILYAMWSGNYTIGALTYMQDFADLSVDAKDKVIASMEVGAQYQLTDNRDNIKYWIAKQADGHVWMTQNLDLCVGCTGTAALTSDNTDLNASGSGIYTTDYTTSDGVITWAPKATTGSDYASPITSAQTITIVDDNNGTVTWLNSQIYPWSAEGGERYYYAPDANVGDIPSNSCNTSNDTCKHYHVGNYYNWSEVVASSDSTNLSARYSIAENSICPKGWRLPMGLSSPTSTASSREFGQLLYTTGITTALTSSGANYTTNGAVNIRKAPLFLIRSGTLWTDALHYSAADGRYWSSTVIDSNAIYVLNFTSFDVYSAREGYSRFDGRSVRCLVR